MVFLNKKFYVYAWIRKDYDTYFYIGKGTGDRYKRIKNRSVYFKNIYNKTNTDVVILFDNLSEKDALNKEREVIHDLVYNKHYSINIKGIKRVKGRHLVNMTFGGEGTSGHTFKMSDEQRKKISERKKGTQQGKENHFFGKKHTEETKALIRKKATGRKQSEETRAKYNRRGEKNNMYGKKGDLSPIKGTHRTEEEKLKQRKALGTPVRCIELNMIFDSLSYAELYMKNTYNITLTRHTIKSRCDKTSSRDWCGKIEIKNNLVKLHWEYVENTLATTE